MSADFYGLDTVSFGGSIRFPGVLDLFLDHEAPPQGVSCGVAFSFPGFMGGDWDVGAYGTVAAGGGSAGIGGKVSVDVGYHEGSVGDLSGRGAELGGHYGRYGGSGGVDDSNSPTGFTAHYGVGYNVNASGTLTGTASVRDGVKGYND